MADYPHIEIEKRWQKQWMTDHAFAASNDHSKKKFFTLIEFPYPSGAGLHVGHPRPYIALDIVARKRRAEGYNVLYPIGWDAFGLPTENYAIKTGRRPEEITKENTDTFRRQIQSLGISFDWSREINTTDPNYYKWTQWIFLQLYKKGLAYKAKTEINWCPKDKIGLANEEVVDGKCERCGTEVVKREKEQWMLAITKYAQRLYDDLDTVDYIERAKTQQRNWIGPSEGALITFTLSGIEGQKDGEHSVEIFTTRPDTIFGATFIAVSPELAKKWIALGWKASSDVQTYVKNTIKEKSQVGRKNIEEKTGVDTGIQAINPATKLPIPVWITNYVLGDVGTGAIMAVPAHDEHDFDFAKKFSLPTKYVIEVPEYHPKDTPYVEKGIVTNSEVWMNGLLSEDAADEIISELEYKKVAKRSTTFKLRDWVFSRQRYWGEPIPMISCQKCGWVPVPEDQLPVRLPEVTSYEYTETGESPLANIHEWVNTVCPTCGGNAKRETDTMPNWAGSSWYYLRYTDPHNEKELASKANLAYWLAPNTNTHSEAADEKLARLRPVGYGGQGGVDWYNGGMEHTVLHLLYSRFWHKFLFDIGVVPTSEPYLKRTSHGVILANDGEKMSKSKGNVVNPDDIIVQFGADSLRVYEMFMGPFDQAIAWSVNGLVGARRFLERVHSLAEKVSTTTTATPELEKHLHQTIKKVSDDIEGLKMNTAVAALMTTLNELSIHSEVPTSAFATFLRLLAPFAPHLTEELWTTALGKNTSIHAEAWPVHNPALLTNDIVSFAVQINGKLRGTFEGSPDISDTEAIALAQKVPRVAEYLMNKAIKKTIVIKGKIVSFVTNAP